MTLAQNTRTRSGPKVAKRFATSFLKWGIVLALSACGAISTPMVVEETTAVGAVQIIGIDANTLDRANRSDYQPRTLPAIFARTTGIETSARSFGPLPNPAHEAEDRPNQLPMRIPPAYTPDAYQIGVGDVVMLATPQTGGSLEDLSGLLAAQNRRQGYTVQDDGAVAIPDVGRVKIAGLTLQEAEAAVFQALVGIQIEPSFSLEISEFNSRRVSVGGAVRNPLVVPIALTPLYLSEALAKSGGVTASDLDYVSIRIYREGAMYHIPFQEYLGSADLQRTALRDGDAVFVDTEYDLTKASGYFAEQIQLQTARIDARTAALDQLSTEIQVRRAELQEGRANFTTRVELDAVVRDYVYIAGEVGSQSRFTLPFERRATLADALFSQGGGVPNATGNIGEVYVLRGTGDGHGIVAWHLNAHNAANLVLATQFELRPNDVIFVSERPLTALSRVMSQIGTSVSLLL